MLKYAYVPECWNDEEHHQIHIWPYAFKRLVVFEDDHNGHSYPKLSPEVRKWLYDNAGSEN